MTIEEVVSELNAVQAEVRSPDGYHTTEEIADAWGVSRKVVLTKLKVLSKADRLDVATVQRLTITGDMRKVPAYRVLPA